MVWHCRSIVNGYIDNVQCRADVTGSPWNDGKDTSNNPSASTCKGHTLKIRLETAKGRMYESKQQDHGCTKSASAYPSVTVTDKTISSACPVRARLQSPALTCVHDSSP